jgi:hypothetical protein
VYSFTGPYKHFKLSKGGAILTDSHEAYFGLNEPVTQEDENVHTMMIISIC